MATIIQAYGPIYGEAVNGTVQGRPNGSVFVPLSNKITLLITGVAEVHMTNATTYALNGGNYSLWAESQDLANCMNIVIYSDSACTVPIARRIFGAGIFNIRGYASIWKVADSTDPSVGDTVYIRAELISVSSTPVAVSDAVALEVVA